MSFGRNGFSGFPFENRRARDPLDDLAQRHPEIAQHLQGFPRRSQDSEQQDPFLRRPRFDRPFGSGRFERFGFPFDRDEFEREPQRYRDSHPEYFDHFPNQQQPAPQNKQQQQASSQTSSGYQQYPPHFSQEYQPQPKQYQQSTSEATSQSQSNNSSQSVSQGTQTDDAEVQEKTPTAQEASPVSKPEGSPRGGRPIQQSNTCDLAQHQTPSEEALNDRGQRSMSAPPENKRFTSSVNIPMGGPQDNEGPKASTSSSSGSTERVIPIHVEGRDVPVVPKNFTPTQSQQQQQSPQPERIFTDGPRSQPETIFGHRPDAFTRFVHRDPHRFPGNDWHSFGSSFPEEEFGFGRSESPSRFTKPHQQSQQSQKQPQSPKQQPQPPQPPQPQTPPTQETPQQQPTPPPQKQPPSPIEQIQVIQKDVSTLLRQVEAFNGAPKDKNYLYLDEMLTRNLLKLDNIDTQGQDSIRSARKEAIKCIEKAISLLEAKAAANVAKPDEEKMEVVEPAVATEENPEKTLSETEDKSQEQVMETVPIEQNTCEGGDQQQDIVKEEEIKKEVESESVPEPQQTDIVSEETPKATAEGEKKDKKKIKKKVNKEEKKQ
ncbi:hypothetical protein ABEB36_009957 [Hypothenemus hampei]|uniref:BAG domain-containing protein n=1 Tax=Hypothenemus hampei TaxID=57062 RepID=A0ABD1EIG4_HYPHA